jgi:hypothetical protein
VSGIFADKDETFASSSNHAVTRKDTRAMADTGNENEIPALLGAFSISQFCRTYGVGRTFCYAELKAGRLKARKAANRTLIPRADAQAWFASLPKVRSSDSGAVARERAETSEAA